MKTTTAIGYRCPRCGTAVVGEIDLFRLSGKEIHLKCSCGSSALLISHSKENGKIRLSVPCVACPTPHPYRFSDVSLFNKDIFVLSCSITGLDICFTGDREKVTKALDESGEYLASLLGEKEDGHSGHRHLYSDSNEDIESEGCIYDPVLMSDIITILKDFAIESAIKCPCGTSSISVSVEYDKIVLSCRCGRRCTVNAKTEHDKETLLEKAEIVLRDDN